MLTFRIENLNRRLYNVCVFRRPDIIPEEHFRPEDDGKIKFLDASTELEFPIRKRAAGESRSQHLERALSLGGLVMGAACFATVKELGLRPELQQGNFPIEMVAKKHFRMRAGATGCLIGYFATTVAAFATPINDSDDNDDGSSWKLELPALTDYFEQLLADGCSAQLSISSLNEDSETVKFSLEFTTPLPLD
jgi:hypothetical protein